MGFSVRIFIVVLLSSCASLLLVATVSLNDLYLEIQGMDRELFVEMSALKDLADRAWLGIRDLRVQSKDGSSADSFDGQGSHIGHSFARYVFGRAKREAGHTKCTCVESSNKCPAGKPGVPGVPGTPGQNGQPGKPGRAGRPGLVIVDSEGGCYICPPGPLGPEGAPGRPGSTGPPGLTGSPGEHGRQGEPGYQGPVGSIGESGSPGRMGPPGRPGRDAVIARGSKGPPGVRGLRGSVGDAGQPGEPAPPGPQGSPGEQGGPGPRGQPGYDGGPGLDGVDGGPGEDADYCPCPDPGTPTVAPRPSHPPTGRSQTASKTANRPKDRQQIGRLTPAVTLSSQEAPWIRKIKRVSKSALVTQQQKAEGVIRRSRSQARTPGQQQPDHSAVIVQQHKPKNSTKTQA